MAQSRRAPKSETAPVQLPQRNGRVRRRPVFIVKAKQHPQSQNWITLGVAFSFRDGSPGLAIKLHALPLNFDGLVALFPPQNADEVAAESEAFDPETGELPAA